MKWIWRRRNHKTDGVHMQPCPRGNILTIYSAWWMHHRAVDVLNACMAHRLNSSYAEHWTNGLSNGIKINIYCKTLKCVANSVNYELPGSPWMLTAPEVFQLNISDKILSWKYILSSGLTHYEWYQRTSNAPTDFIYENDKRGAYVWWFMSSLKCLSFKLNPAIHWN